MLNNSIARIAWACCALAMAVLASGALFVFGSYDLRQFLFLAAVLVLVPSYLAGTAWAHTAGRFETASRMGTVVWLLLLTPWCVWWGSGTRYYPAALQVAVQVAVLIAVGVGGFALAEREARKTRG